MIDKEISVEPVNEGGVLKMKNEIISEMLSNLCQACEEERTILLHCVFGELKGTFVDVPEFVNPEKGIVEGGNNSYRLSLEKISYIEINKDDTFDYFLHYEGTKNTIGISII